MLVDLTEVMWVDIFISPSVEGLNSSQSSSFLLFGHQKSLMFTDSSSFPHSYVYTLLALKHGYDLKHFSETALLEVTNEVLIAKSNIVFSSPDPVVLSLGCTLELPEQL